MRHGFFLHLRYFVVVNAAIYLFYLFAESHGYWPLYIFLLWGFSLAGHFWRTFLRSRPPAAKSSSPAEEPEKVEPTR